MKLLKRFALSAFTRRLGLLSLLSIAPFTHADTTGGGPLSFDVPEPGESITINLLQLGRLDSNWFLSEAQFLVDDSFLSTKIVGQYCVAISNLDTKIGEDNELALNIAANFGLPTRSGDNRTAKSGAAAAAADVPNPIAERIPVIDDNETRGVPPNDSSCFGLNQSPRASLKVPDGVNDTDFANGENVTLDASGSVDPDGKIIDYTFIANDTVLAAGANPIVTVRLPDGVTLVTVIVTDDSGQSEPVPTATLSASRSKSSFGEGGYAGDAGYGGSGPTAQATATVEVDPPQRLTVNAGTDITQADTDGVAGEVVQLNVSNSTNVPANIPVTFQFFLNPGSENDGTPIGTGPQLSRRFNDGKSVVRVVANAGDQRASDDLTINVTPPQLVVNLENINQPDTDAASGELITLDASKATNAPPGAQVVFQFFLNPGDGNGELLPSELGVLRRVFDDGRSIVRVVAIFGEQRAFTDVTINVAAPQELTVQLDDINRVDTDGIAGELITLDASKATNAPPGVQVSFQFFLNPDGESDGTSISEGTGPVLNRRFDDGESTVRVVALAGDQRAFDDVLISVAAPQAFTVQLDDINQPDTDAVAGETITLDASKVTNARPDLPLTFQFFLNPGEGDGTLISTDTGPTLTRRFPDGVSRVRVVVFAGDEQRAVDDARITVVAPPKFVLNLDNINQPDTDAAAGELITLDASNATNAPPGVQVTFQFFLNPSQGSNGTPLPSGEQPGVLMQRFADGTSIVRVVASVGEQSASADVTINVAAPVASVVANAGGDLTMPDSDGRLGEVVTLNASGSKTPTDGSVTFQWFLNPSGESNGTLLGSGQILVTRNPVIPDGMNTVRLVVTAGGQVSTDEIMVTVTTRQAASLANLPNLTPNQRRTAVALDDVCTRLLGLESGALTGTIGQVPSGPAAALSADQLDLTDKCRGIVFNNSVDNQVEAISDITPEDFAVARTQALLFANTQYTSTLDRLIALRGGARGLSLAGLNIVVDGQNVPVAAIQDMVGKIFGSGASADATEEPGGLLSDRLGMWVRGNYSSGGRDRSLVSPSFDADQMGVILGTDYRLGRNAVIGASIAYLDSSIDFNPIGEGSLDTESMALSVYGSVYAAKSFYLDGLVNYAMADYDARRNISYTQGSQLGDLALDANGSTEGDTISAGLFGGYDFVVKGVTISPNLGFFYVDATIDGFTEGGAGGFNLLYDEQNFKSLTSNIGFRVNATWNLPWVVLLPGLRFDFIREFEDDVDVFQVRFAADPNGLSAPPIMIQTDNPDTSYTRMSLNLSAQFKFGFAGYIEYQRIGGFDQIDFQDLAFGFRMQRSF